MTRQYASCLLLRLKSRLGKVAISAALNKAFCPTPPTLIHRRFKHRQKTKINKTMLSSSPSSFFHTKFTTSVLKSKQLFHPTKTELGPPVSESSTGLKILCPTDSEHRFHNKGIENCFPIGFNLALINTTLCSTTNGEILKLPILKVLE